jgi:hypothetical protein
MELEHGMLHNTRKWIVWLVAITSLGGDAAGQAKKLKTGAKPTSATIAVNQEFCDTTTPYRYSDGEITRKDSNLTGTVTDPIPNLHSFGDPGKVILDPTKPDGVGLMSDGSDVSRLLVRTFAAGACPDQIPQNVNLGKGGFSLLPADFILSILSFGRSMLSR